MSIQPGVGYTFNASSQGWNITVQQPWFPYIPLVTDTFACSPFLVHDPKLVTGEGGSYVTYEICPGAYNNLIPEVYDTVNEVWSPLNDLADDAELILDFNSTTTCCVYLRIGNDGSYPDTVSGDGYPRVFSYSSVPTDDDDYAYLLIATVTEVSASVYTVSQYITGSLWGDRIKIGTDTARYYHARL